MPMPSLTGAIRLGTTGNNQNVNWQTFLQLFNGTYGAPMTLAYWGSAPCGDDVTALTNYCPWVGNETIVFPEFDCGDDEPPPPYNCCPGGRPCSGCCACCGGTLIQTFSCDFGSGPVAWMECCDAGKSMEVRLQTNSPGLPLQVGVIAGAGTRPCYDQLIQGTCDQAAPNNCPTAPGQRRGRVEFFDSAVIAGSSDDPFNGPDLGQQPCGALSGVPRRGDWHLPFAGQRVRRPFRGYPIRMKYRPETPKEKAKRLRDARVRMDAYAMEAGRVSIPHVYPRGDMRAAIDAQRRRTVAERLRAAKRFATCEDCEHYNDDAVTGEPMPRPCKLAPRLSLCAWKRLVLHDNAAKPAAGCPWPLSETDGAKDRAKRCCGG